MELECTRGTCESVASKEEHAGIKLSTSELEPNLARDSDLLSSRSANIPTPACPLLVVHPHTAVSTAFSHMYSGYNTPPVPLASQRQSSHHAQQIQALSSMLDTQNQVKGLGSMVHSALSEILFVGNYNLVSSSCADTTCDLSEKWKYAIVPSNFVFERLQCWTRLNCIMCRRG